MEKTRISNKIRGYERKRRTVEDRYKCSYCFYTSERLFNISRHETRIHSALSKKRQCCGIFFITKGDFYLHCEESHPGSRANLISRNKYKIYASSRKLWKKCSTTNENVSRMKEGDICAGYPYILRTGVRQIKKDERQIAEYASSTDESTMESTIPMAITLDYGTKRSSTATSINSFLINNEHDSFSTVLTRDTSSEGSFKIDTKMSSWSEFDSSSNENMNDGDPDYEPPMKLKKPNEDEDYENSIDPGSICSENGTNNDTIDGSLDCTSPNVKDDKTRENVRFGALATMAAAILPIKKRILRQIATSSLENLPEPTSYSPAKIETTVIGENRENRENCDTTETTDVDCGPMETVTVYCDSSEASSSDTENIPPNVGERNNLPGEVDVLFDPRIDWKEVTELQRDFLADIDFDSLARY